VEIVVATSVTKRLSQITRAQNSGSYEFTCWFGEGVNIKSQVDQAITICVSGNYVSTTLQNRTTAVVQAAGDSAEVNRSILECIRSFLLMHGWEAAESNQPGRSWKERAGWHPAPKSRT
jgi:hypothetical protein